MFFIKPGSCRSAADPDHLGSNFLAAAANGSAVALPHDPAAAAAAAAARTLTAAIQHLQ
jgi:hypothetical protein